MKNSTDLDVAGKARDLVLNLNDKCDRTARSSGWA